jgi:hypothetical protein
MFSLVKSIVNNQQHFETNSLMHGVNTGSKNHLCRTVFSLACLQKVRLMLASEFLIIYFIL